MAGPAGGDGGRPARRLLSGGELGFLGAVPGTSPLSFQQWFRSLPEVLRSGSELSDTEAHSHRLNRNLS